jgi:hypothetical protein
VILVVEIVFIWQTIILGLGIFYLAIYRDWLSLSMLKNPLSFVALTKKMSTRVWFS